MSLLRRWMMEDFKLFSDATLQKLQDESTVKGTKEGVEIDKGFVLTERYLLEHLELFEKYWTFFTAYPDLFIDLITPSDSNFQLFFYQRIFLRACFRYRYHYVTACRAFSKTFLSILAIYLQCMFFPGTKRFICAPGKGQSAKIAKEKILEIWDKFPLLQKEIVGNGTFGKDYVTLTFRNGSIFDVVGALDSERGGRRHGLKFSFSASIL